MTAEKFAHINAIRNRMIVADQEHRVRMNRMRLEIREIGCDHRDPSGQLIYRGDFRHDAFCKLCDEQVA